MEIFSKEILRRLVTRTLYHKVDRIPLGTLFPAEFNLFVEENRFKGDLTPITGTCYRNWERSKCLVWKFDMGYNFATLGGVQIGCMVYQLPNMEDDPSGPWETIRAWIIDRPFLIDTSFISNNSNQGEKAS